MLRNFKTRTCISDTYTIGVIKKGKCRIIKHSACQVICDSAESCLTSILLYWPTNNFWFNSWYEWRQWTIVSMFYVIHNLLVLIIGISSKNALRNTQFMTHIISNMFRHQHVRVDIQGGSNMTGTDLYVNKPHCAAAVRPWESEATICTLPPARIRTCSVLSGSS